MLIDLFVLCERKKGVREIAHLLVHSPNCQQQLEKGQPETRKLGTQAGPPTQWQGAKDLSDPCCLPGCVPAGRRTGEVKGRTRTRTQALQYRTETPQAGLNC